jgi:hypothetical protein
MLRVAMRLTGFVSVIVLASAQVKDSSEAKPYDDVEAYNVYSTILPNEWPWSAANATTLVIRSETEPYAGCISPDKESEKVVGSAIADYKKENRTKWLLQRQFQIEKPYEIVNSDTIAIVQKEGGWNGFYNRYPNSGGWIELSAVGFNPSKTIAVVYAGHSCGGLCGGGMFHILQKVDGKWVPLRFKGVTSCSWQS